MRKRSVTLAVLGTFVAASEGRAQQFSPLVIPPKPNVIVAVDTSHEMALRTNGSRYDLTNNRLFDLKNAFIGTPPLYQNGSSYVFRNEFVWGGFAYSGSQFAKIKDGSGTGPFNTVNTIRVPNPGNAAGYQSTVGMISTLTPDYCTQTKRNPACTENTLPGGVALACLTPTLRCLGDQVVLASMLRGGVPGFRVPSAVLGMTLSSSVACTNPSVPPGLPTPTCATGGPGVYIKPLCELLHELSYFSYPRFTPPNIAAVDVRDQLCDPLYIAFSNVQAKLNACLAPASPTTPDLSPATAPSMSTSGYQCDPNQISRNVCSGLSVLQPTCVCDQGNPACAGLGARDACGVPYSFRARQQVAMCFSHNPNPGQSPIRSALAAEPDNIVNGACRPNVITYLTDGIAGNTTGVLLESPANFATYRQRATGIPGASENWVIQIGNRPEADTMEDAIQDALPGAPLGVTALSAVNQGQVKSTFSQALNRNLKGTYTAANIAFDRFETRAAFYSYEVPGAPDLNNDRRAAYLGRPSRISWHRIPDPTTGVIDPVPLFETDWSTKAGQNALGGAITEIDSTVFPGGPGGTDPDLGPTGTWIDGLTQKVVTIPSGTLDRNGDGIITGAEQPVSVTWGYLLGGENAAPVIVESPRDVPAGSDAREFALFERIGTGTSGSRTSIADRPRVILALANGYVVGFHGGRYTGRASLPGRTTIEKSYDDSVPEAGQELFRIRPSFIYAANNASTSRVADNSTLQQPLMNGHMIVREVLMQAVPPRFSTLLVFTQGSAGRGFAAVDISDPVPGGPSLGSLTNGVYAYNAGGNGPQLLWEQLLPNCADPACVGPGQNDKATSKPVIYVFPQPNVASPDRGKVSVLAMVGGAGGTPNLYAYRLRDGQLLTQAALPGLPPGFSYRVAPSCVDGDSGLTQFCYVLGGNGTLVRVTVDKGTGAFAAVDDITPPGIVDNVRQFWTEPVVTFDRSNAVNIFFGSGDIQALDRPAGGNFMFKVIDRVTSNAGGGVDFATNVCRPGSGGTSGRIAFATGGEMVVSPPVLSKGALAYTTYAPGANGCTLGAARLYVMSFESCADGRALLAPPTRPQDVPIGTGVPTSPSVLRRSAQIMTHTSAAPTAEQAQLTGATTKAGTRQPIQKGYYLPWRIQK